MIPLAQFLGTSSYSVSVSFLCFDSLISEGSYDALLSDYMAVYNQMAVENCSPNTLVYMKVLNNTSTEIYPCCLAIDVVNRQTEISHVSEFPTVAPTPSPTTFTPQPTRESTPTRPGAPIPLPRPPPSPPSSPSPRPPRIPPVPPPTRTIPMTPGGPCAYFNCGRRRDRALGDMLTTEDSLTHPEHRYLSLTDEALENDPSLSDHLLCPFPGAVDEQVYFQAPDKNNFQRRLNIQLENLHGSPKLVEIVESLLTPSPTLAPVQDIADTQNPTPTPNPFERMSKGRGRRFKGRGKGNEAEKGSTMGSAKSTMVKGGMMMMKSHYDSSYKSSSMMGKKSSSSSMKGHKNSMAIPKHRHYYHYMHNNGMKNSMNVFKMRAPTGMYYGAGVYWKKMTANQMSYQKVKGAPHNGYY